jgi:phytoene/squalene synthetase
VKEPGIFEKQTIVSPQGQKLYSPYQKIYFNILEKIEKMNYNVFHKKAKVSKIKKLYYTFGVFMKYKVAYR